MDAIDEMYFDTVFDSCDDETKEALRELMKDGYDLEEAIMVLEEEGRL